MGYFNPRIILIPYDQLSEDRIKSLNNIKQYTDSNGCINDLYIQEPNSRWMGTNKLYESILLDLQYWFMIADNKPHEYIDIYCNSDDSDIEDYSEEFCNILNNRMYNWHKNSINLSFTNNDGITDYSYNGLKNLKQLNGENINIKESIMVQY